MSFKVFIAGTDTNIGKTYLSVALLNAFNQLGFSTIGIKPIATGCFVQNNVLYNDDALALQNAASIKLPYEDINPFVFEPPVSPNIAALHAGTALTIKKTIEKITPALNHVSDITIVEGVGGWLVPINETETMADFVKELQLPVILVVGIRLGCINHALLTHEAMQNKNIKLLGWIANCFDPNQDAEEDVINTLEHRLKAPLLAKISFQSDPSKILKDVIPHIYQLPMSRGI